MSHDCEHESDDDCRGERGKRGKRGPRGHIVSGGLLKFSGIPEGNDGDVAGISYLPDAGFSAVVDPVITPIDYPTAVHRHLRNLAANILDFVVAPNGSIKIELLQNGIPVPGFVVTYVSGSPAIQVVAAGPVSFDVEDEFDLRVTTALLGDQSPDISATVGVE